MKTFNMQNRIKDIEGSLLSSVSDDLNECVVNKRIHYVTSFRYKRGVIVKAKFDNNMLDLYVSKGHIVEGLFLCFTIIIIISIIFGVI